MVFYAFEERSKFTSLKRTVRSLHQTSVLPFLRKLSFVLMTIPMIGMLTRLGMISPHVYISAQDKTEYMGAVLVAIVGGV